MTDAELLAAVLANADVLWAVQDKAPTVAGPWRGKWNNRHRAYRDPQWIARVWLSSGTLHHGDGHEQWEATVCSATSHEQTVRTFDGADRREDAEQWCDARLREAGVLLATESP